MLRLCDLWGSEVQIAWNYMLIFSLIDYEKKLYVKINKWPKYYLGVVIFCRKSHFWPNNKFWRYTWQSISRKCCIFCHNSGIGSLFSSNTIFASASILRNFSTKIMSTTSSSRRTPPSSSENPNVILIIWGNYIQLNLRRYPIVKYNFLRNGFENWPEIFVRKCFLIKLILANRNINLLYV